MAACTAVLPCRVAIFTATPLCSFCESHSVWNEHLSAQGVLSMGAQCQCVQNVVRPVRSSISIRSLGAGAMLNLPFNCYEMLTVLDQHCMEQPKHSCLLIGSTGCFVVQCHSCPNPTQIRTHPSLNSIPEMARMERSSATQFPFSAHTVLQCSISLAGCSPSGSPIHRSMQQPVPISHRCTQC